MKLLKKLFLEVYSAIHARQLWSEIIKFAIFIEPYTSHKAENLKFSKIYQRKLSRLKYVRELQLNLCETYNFFPAYQETLMTTVTCRCLALNFHVKFWSYV